MGGAPLKPWGEDYAKLGTHTTHYPTYICKQQQITVLFTFRTAHFARQSPARFHCVKQTRTPSTPIPHPRSSSSSIPWRVVRSPSFGGGGAVAVVAVIQD